MKRDDIIKEVLSVIDEIGGINSVNIADSYPISTILDQAGRELLLIAPISTIETTTCFKTATIEAREDGSGTIVLPDNFLRLSQLRLRGWHKAVYETISVSSRKYAKQFHRATRGGIARPVVALHRDKLEYFIAQAGTTPIIDEAEYVEYSGVEDNNYPERLIDILVWLTAIMSLKVMGEYDAAKVAEEEYERLLNNLFIAYGK